MQYAPALLEERALCYSSGPCLTAFSRSHEGPRERAYDADAIPAYKGSIPCDWVYYPTLILSSEKPHPYTAPRRLRLLPTTPTFSTARDTPLAHTLSAVLVFTRVPRMGQQSRFGEPSFWMLRKPSGIPCVRYMQCRKPDARGPTEKRDSRNRAPAGLACRSVYFLLRARL